MSMVRETRAATDTVNPRGLLENSLPQLALVAVRSEASHRFTEVTTACYQLGNQQRSGRDGESERLGNFLFWDAKLCAR
jgi:hypothetical protein